ncbi:MAG: GspE/PulE family protein [Deltaproteobacteria bacterium]|nr:GspE/PulE family protein [Deltaproteobacteria bacterium]
MASRDSVGAGAAGTEQLPLTRILIEEGLVTPEQVGHAERVRTKLRSDRSLLEVVKELYGLDDMALQAVLARRRQDVRLGDLLVELGYLRREYLETALAIQREDPASKLRIGEVLVAHHFIEESRLVEVLAIHLGFPLETPDLADTAAELVDDVPLRYCEQHEFVPVRRENDCIVVAFADPTHPGALEAAEGVFGKGRVVAAIAARTAIQTALRRLAGREGAVVVEGASGSLVVEIVDEILQTALDQGASDVHFDPRPDRLTVRLRVDGVLAPLRDLPRTVAPAIATRIKVLCQADIAERRRHQGGRFLYEAEGRHADLRVSIYVTVHGEKIVLRVLNQDRRLLSLGEIGMAPHMLERLRDDALERPSGVVLVTGPTGSGKTTTLYSCIQEIRSEEISILTAEDPVEYVIDGIGQCSLNPAIDLTFEETLRHIVRQDPDVIVIGEIRDRLSAETAIQAALTGHKVLTTFHTEDTIGGLVRLLNMNIEAFLISSTVVSVVAQRLMRRVCSQCAQPHRPTQVELRRLGCPPAALEGATFRAGRGCDACRHTGYKGRVAAYELLVLDAAVRDAILARASSHEIRKICRESTGLVTLFEDGLVRAARGDTTLREVIRMLPRLDRPRPLAEVRRLLGW